LARRRTKSLRISWDQLDAPDSRRIKPIERVVMACLRVFLLLVLCWPMMASAVKLRVCFDTRPHLPYITPEGGGTVGMLIRMAAAEAGLELDVYSVPITRCREEIRANVATGFPTTPYVPSELDFLAFPTVQGVEDPSRAVMMARTVVYRRKGSKVDWDGKQFTHLSTPVLVVFGSPMVSNRIKAMGLPMDDKGKSIESNLAKLLAGRADVALGWESDGRPWLARPEFSGKIEVLPQPFSVVPYYLAIAKQFVVEHPGAAEQMWNAIGRIKHTPQYLNASKELQEQLAQAAKASKE
jgi:polar amino acid transport system substrate-binding protein